MKDEEQLRSLTIHAMKELGEIAEVLVKKNRPDHWKNELGDLCGLCINPMLNLAGMTFEEACALGLERKNTKKFKLTDKGETIVNMIRSGIAGEQAQTIYKTESGAKFEVLELFEEI